MDNIVLEELVKNSRKQLFYARIRTLTTLVIAFGVVVCIVVALPAVLNTVVKVNTLMEQVSDTVTLANTAVESVTEMSASISEMGTNMDTFISDNSQTVADVMKKIDAVDFEGLNSAIKDLGDVVEPLANFFGKFSR